VNVDQTGLNLVPAASWTYEQRGATVVAVIGAEDKRQITACLASSLYGDLLPLQLIFTGTTTRCHRCRHRRQQRCQHPHHAQRQPLELLGDYAGLGEAGAASIR